MQCAICWHGSIRIGFGPQFLYNGPVPEFQRDVIGCPWRWRDLLPPTASWWKNWAPPLLLSSLLDLKKKGGVGQKWRRGECGRFSGPLLFPIPYLLLYPLSLWFQRAGGHVAEAVAGTPLKYSDVIWWLTSGAGRTWASPATKGGVRRILHWWIPLKGTQDGHLLQIK